MSATPTVQVAYGASEALQHNYLLVHVDQLDSPKPALRSVWGIFVYLPEPSSVMIVPLYPLEDAKRQDKFASNFSLGKDQLASPQFVEAVEQSLDLNFQYALVVDDEGMQSVRGWLADQMKATAPAPNSSIREAEKSFFQAACTFLDPSNPDGAPFPWTLIFPQHAATNLPFQTAILDWQSLRSGQSSPVRCEVFDNP